MYNCEPLLTTTTYIQAAPTTWNLASPTYKPNPQGSHQATTLIATPPNSNNYEAKPSNLMNAQVCTYLNFLTQNQEGSLPLPAFIAATLRVRDSWLLG